MPCTPDEAAALRALMALTIPKRIAAVSADVKSRADKFAWLPAADLAEALGIGDPSLSDGWSRTTYADDLSIEEYAADNTPSDLLDWLTPTARRAKILAKKAVQLDAGGVPDFGFLTPEERETIKDAIDETMLRDNAENGVGCVASITVRGDRKKCPLRLISTTAAEPRKCELRTTCAMRRRGRRASKGRPGRPRRGASGRTSHPARLRCRMAACFWRPRSPSSPATPAAAQRRTTARRTRRSLPRVPP